MGKIYVVVEDGCKSQKGSKMYLKGAFTDKVKATKVAFLGGKVITVEENEFYPFKHNEAGDGENELYLGGYVEP